MGGSNNLVLGVTGDGEKLATYFPTFLLIPSHVVQGYHYFKSHVMPLESFQL